MFGAKPLAATAITTRCTKGDCSVEDSAVCSLHFPADRLATFCVSFGADRTSAYRVVGTKGSVLVEPGYELANGLKLHFNRGGKKRTIRYAKRDQFAPEIIYFANCILNGTEPEPSGEEGLADVRVIRALYRSAKSGRRVALSHAKPRREPTLRQEKTTPPVRMPRLVHVTPPSG